MWFQALEFVVSCTVAKYILYCSRRTYLVLYPFFKNWLSCSPLRRQSKHATELRFASRCPRRHLVHAGRAIAAATVFLDRAAEEQSTFYTDFCCCRATYELPSHKKAPDHSTAVKIYLATVQEIANSSAWNHIFKFRRQGRDGRRSRKLLSLCHTHGSLSLIHI